MGRSAKVKRVLGYLLALIILAFLGQTLYTSWDQVAARGFRFEFNWLLLSISFPLLVIARGFAVEAWRRILLALGDRTEFRFAFYAWFVSNLARYIPGNIWQVAAMLVLVQRAGISKMNALLSQAVYTAIALSVAALFGLTLLPLAQDYVLFAALFFLALITFFALPPVFRWMVMLAARVLRLVRKNGKSDPPPLPQLSFVQGLIPPICSSVMWLINGLAFYLFVRSLYDIPLQQLPSFVAINAAAYFIGYVSFITPSGLGFREGALAVMLTPFFPGPPGLFPSPLAVAIAFLARIWSTVGEMLGVGIALWGAPRARVLPQKGIDTSPLPQ